MHSVHSTYLEICMKPSIAAVELTLTRSAYTKGVLVVALSHQKALT